MKKILFLFIAISFVFSSCVDENKVILNLQAAVKQYKQDSIKAYAKIDTLQKLQRDFVKEAEAIITTKTQDATYWRAKARAIGENQVPVVISYPGDTTVIKDTMWLPVVSNSYPIEWQNKVFKFNADIDVAGELLRFEVNKIELLVPPAECPPLIPCPEVPKPVAHCNFIKKLLKRCK